MPKKKKLTEKQKAIRTCNMGTMTPSMKKGMIENALRKLSIYWKPLKKSKDRQKRQRVELPTEVEYHNPTKTMPTRMSNTYKINLYECEWCGELVPEKLPKFKKEIVKSGPLKGQSVYKMKLRTNVNIDHKNPVVTDAGFKDWTTYIERLLDEDPDNYQLVCKACHKQITDDENRRRREKKKRLT